MKKKSIITVIIFVAMAAGTVFALQRHHTIDKTPDQVTAANTQFKKPKVAEDGTPVTNVGAKQQNTTPGRATITNLSQDGDKVYVRTLIEGVASGSCNLKLTNGTTTVTKTAPVIPATSYYVCQGFNISKQELSKGTWDVVVNLGNNSAESKKTITVN